jgi:CMP-N-acetylneuraminic acid synthetase
VRTLAIVPARGGSKRLKDKNLRVVGGVTLTRRALTTAAACAALDTVVLSTDDPRIAAEADGVERVTTLMRPPELATDDASAVDVVAHVLDVLGEPFDAVAVVQATSPLTEPADIAATLALLERTGARSAATVVRLDHAVQPQKLKRLEGDRLIPFLEPERAFAHGDLPELWVRNGSVYAAWVSTVRDGALITDDQVGLPMPRERSIDINDELDLAFAEFLLARR